MKINELSIGSGQSVRANISKIGNRNSWLCTCIECKKKFRHNGEVQLAKCKCGAVYSKDKNKGVFAIPCETLTLEDETGTILLDLYDNHARVFNVGDTVNIYSGWVKEFIDTEGNKQKTITPGQYGRIVKVI